jgi:uncharacterized coiled-coil DUF342 family protein
MKKNLKKRIAKIRDEANEYAPTAFIYNKSLIEAVSIIDELQANNDSLEAALAASDSYVEPCKKFQADLSQKLIPALQQSERQEGK